MMRFRFTNILTISIFFTLDICLASTSIKGKVINLQTKQPIEGVNILITDTEAGTATDEKGEFRLIWTGDYPVKIHFSHIGYSKQEIIVLRPDEIRVGLQPKILSGREVTILGQRSEMEREVASSGEQISVNNTAVRGIRDVSEVLQEMSSVTIAVSETGRQETSIRGSNANEVAVFLDGIKLNRTADGIADLSALDLTDLASIEIIRGGNSVLYGPGNFGGVIHLVSKQPHDNNLFLQRGAGITDKNDQDLSGALNLHWKFFGLGGRYSGKSRSYDGRSVYTTLFRNTISTVDFHENQLAVRNLVQNNSMRFPSGNIIARDNLNVLRAEFRGTLFNSQGWEAHYGRRQWDWQDSFFNNIDRTTGDKTTSQRISKYFHWNSWDGTIQWENENQHYSGENQIKPGYSSFNWKDTAHLKLSDQGWASVLRFTTPTETTQSARFELGLRQSKAGYSHSQTVLKLDSLTVRDSVHYSISSGEILKTLRLGTLLEGKTLAFRYNLFFNQGWNKRLPTLNDYFLWFTMNNQAQAITQDISQDSLVVLFSGVLSDKLLVEHVSTTELGGELSWDYSTIAPITSWTISMSIFRNHYVDKIAYRMINGFLPIPYNTPIAALNGFEIATRVNLLWIFGGTAELAGNVVLLKLSNNEVFPNKPGSISHLTLDWEKGVLHLNISHIYEGAQLYQRGGIDIRRYDSRRNTNLTLTLQKTIWKLRVSLSYSVRNLFSEKVTFVDFAHFSSDPFNYYQAHRSLLSFRIALAGQEDN